MSEDQGGPAAEQRRKGNWSMLVLKATFHEACEMQVRGIRAVSSLAVGWGGVKE